MSIDFFCLTDTRNMPYANFLRENAIHLSSKKHDLHFKCIVVEGRETYDINSLETEWSIVDVTPDMGHPSYTHGTGLNKILDHASSDYTVVADCDVSILLKNWDTWFASFLTNKTKIVGAGFPVKHDRYQNFPSVFFFMASTSVLLDIRPDFRPEMTKRWKCNGYTITDSKDALQQGRNVGDDIRQDTGWRLPKFFYDAGYKGKSFAPDRKSGIGRAANYQHEGKMILSHFGKCQKRPFDCDRSILWQQWVKDQISQYNIT